jgi:hypothetical protein
LDLGVFVVLDFVGFSEDVGDWVFRVWIIRFSDFGFGLFSFADTKMRRKEGVWKFFRQRGGFARPKSVLPDEGISCIGDFLAEDGRLRRRL